MQPRYIALIVFFVFTSIFDLNACDNLTLNYTFTCATEGDVVDVTWTSSGCDPTYEINVSLLSLVPFATQQVLNNNTNSGSAMFTIGAHPPGNYQFYIQVSSGQGTCGATNWYTYGPTFEIKAAVPVNFGEFYGELRENSSLLSWNTHSEINNQGFEIQHAGDTKNWEEIGFIEGEGNSSNLNNYSFNHQEPYDGLNFYRLKQIDLNGDYAYSDIITLRMEHNKEKNDLTIYPNPCHNEIHIFSSSEKSKYSIFSSMGKLVTQGITRKNQIDVSYLKPGLYYLSLDKNGSMQSFLKR